MPLPSLPMTMAAGPRRSAPVRVVSPSAAVPNTQMPRAFRSRIVATRFVNAGHGHIFERTGRGLADDGRRPTLRRRGMMTPCAPAHSAVRMIAPRLCWIGQLVADDEQGRLALLLRGVQHIVDRGIVMGGDGSHNALMRARGAHVVELAAVDAHDDGAALLCHGGKAAKRTVRVAVGQKYLVDGAAAAQRLGDGRCGPRSYPQAAIPARPRSAFSALWYILSWMPLLSGARYAFCDFITLGSSESIICGGCRSFFVNPSV